MVQKLTSNGFINEGIGRARTEKQNNNQSYVFRYIVYSENKSTDLTAIRKEIKEKRGVNDGYNDVYCVTLPFGCNNVDGSR